MVNILRNIRKFIKSIKISTRCFKKRYFINKNTLEITKKNIITILEHSFRDKAGDFFSE